MILNNLKISSFLLAFAYIVEIVPTPTPTPGKNYGKAVYLIGRYGPTPHGELLGPQNCF